MKARLRFLTIAMTATVVGAAAQPTITSFTPSTGPIGTAVTITGTNFSSTPVNNIVFFGATKATVTGASTTQLTVTVPAGTTYQPISVTVGGLTGYSSQPFIVTFPTVASITSGSFEAKVDFMGIGAAGYQVACAIGDIDGDGKPDVVANSYANDNIVVFGNSSSAGPITPSSFEYIVDVPTAPYPYSVAIGDIDGDGKPDLVSANQWDATVSVIKNTSSSGSISFAPKVDFATGNYPIGVAIGDIDGDGKPDLVVVNSDDNTISVIRNTSSSGSISFAPKVDFATGNSPIGVAIGDIDGDGKPDVVVVNYSGNIVSVLRNISSSGSITADSFAAKVDLTTGTHPYAVAVGDVDGDGKPDLVVTNLDDNTISVLRNSSSAGSISFAAKVDFATGNYPIGVAISDIDGDGKPDVVSANQSDATVSVIRNTSSSGSISFAAKVDFGTGVFGGLAIGDIDGDGKPDLVVNSSDGSISYLSILRNKVLAPVSTSQSVVSVTPTTVTSGNTATITLQAKDAAGNNLISGGLTVTFSLTGTGTSSGTIGSVTDNGNGTYTATFTATTSGTAKTVSATIGGSSVTSTMPTITVTAGAVSLSQSLVTVSSSTVLSGSTATITLRAKDGAGNNLTAGGLTVAFSLTGGGTSSGTIGSVTDNVNGTYAATFTGTTTGTAKTISATIGESSVTSPLPTITVTSGAVSLSQSIVTISSSTVASGSTATITLQAKDGAGTNLPTGGLTVAFSLTGGTSNGTIGSVTDNGHGTYNATFTATTAGTAKTVSATIGGSPVTSTLPTVTVTEGAVSLSRSLVAVSSSTIASGSTATITLQAKDGAGNDLTSGGFTVAFSLSGGGTSNGTIASVTDNGDGTYSATFTGTTAGTAKTVSATIDGSSVRSTLPTITVTAGPVSLSQSIVTISPSTVVSGSTATITLRAKDANGNDLTSRGLTVAFLLTGGGTSNGTIGSVTDNGNGTFSATFTGTTAGTAKTVSATIGGSSVTSTSPTITVTAGAVSLSQSLVTVSSSTVVSGSTATVTLRAKDSAGNNLTAGGLTVAFSLTGGGTSSGTIGSVRDNHDGTYSALFAASTAGTPSNINATIDGSPVTSTQPSIKVIAGSASRISIYSGDSQSGAINTVLSKPIIVIVNDAAGNPVAGTSLLFAFASFPSGATGQSLSVPSPSTDLYGQVSVVLTLGNKTGVYSLMALAGSISGSILTFSATATAGAASAIMITSGNNQTGLLSTEIANPLEVTVTDIGGNPVSGKSVTFVIAGSPTGDEGQSLSVANEATNQNGQASTLLTLGNKAGTYSVTATAAGLSGVLVSFSETAMNPVPTVSSISMNRAGRGSKIPITITGTNFIQGVTTMDFGTDITVNSQNLIGGNQILANLTIGALAVLGPRDVTVSNPSPGGGISTLAGIFTVDASPATGVEIMSGAIPEQYTLLNAFPNPFNPSTTIQFGLPERSQARLEIYNLQGEKLVTLVDDTKEAGFYQVRWSANVPSGIYFYRLQAREIDGGQPGDASTGSARGFVETKKMILIK